MQFSSLKKNPSQSVASYICQAKLLLDKLANCSYPIPLQVFATTICNNIGDEFSELVRALVIRLTIATFLELWNVLTDVEAQIQMRATPPMVVHRKRVVDFTTQSKPSAWLVNHGGRGGQTHGSATLRRDPFLNCGSIDHSPYKCLHKYQGPAHSGNSTHVSQSGITTMPP